MAPVTTPALAARDLTFRYPDGHEALAGFDLAVAPGERVAVLGPNGAGKTTFALHCNGLHRPRSGTVEVDGLPVVDQHLAEVRRRVGLVFQDPDDQLFLGTVYEDVAFGPANAGLRGAELEAVVDDALAAVGMSHTRHHAPHHLSGGERRRVAIATVLSMHPSLLVLDEPTSHLDPMAQRELTDLLLELDVTQVVVTHDLPFALELCPRAVVVDGGRVVADGATADLLADARLLAAHRLVLPFGFDPRHVAAGRRG
jgi:cobalt/nickel transport system ATP-binding protein